MFIVDNLNNISEIEMLDKLASIHNELTNLEEETLRIKIDSSAEIGVEFLFYMSTLPFLMKALNKGIEIYCSEKILLQLKNTGYIDRNLKLNTETNITDHLKENSKKIEKDENIFELVTSITTEAPVEMSEKLKSIFISKVGEVYNNAIEHSETDIILGAKYFTRAKDIYCFSCYDTGVGITKKVKNKIENIETDREALEWALKEGNSTEGGPRGLGLNLLQSFAKANDGNIRICSGKILYIYNKEGSKYYDLKYNFKGTLFEMNIISDNNRRYIIK